MKLKIILISKILLLFLVCNSMCAQVDGTLDTSFNSNGTGFSGGTHYWVNTLALQADGKILAGGGNFISYNGQSRDKIARLNSDGSLDVTFDSMVFAQGENGIINAIVVQPDGKILIGGVKTKTQTTEGFFMRLNSDGSIDSSFTNNAILYSESVNSIALQNDGKILVGGYFYQSPNVFEGYLKRLNIDGTIDSSFTIGAGGPDFNTSISTIALQPDGKILIGGNFENYHNLRQNKWILRLNSNGTIDWSFNIGTGFNNTVSKIVVQSDGKILVGGRFTEYNGQQTTKCLTRLNSNGSLDTSFNNSNSVGQIGDYVGSIILQLDGKIIIGGSFGTFNGQSQNRIARLNSDGTLDSSLDIGSGFLRHPNPSGSFVYAVGLQADGKVLVGGNFTEYNKQPQSRITRLNNINTLSIEKNQSEKIIIYPNPVNDFLYLDKEVQKITLKDLSGKIINVNTDVSKIDMSNFSPGIYFIDIEQKNASKETHKVIKK